MMIKLLFTILFSLGSFSLIASCSSCEQKKAHMQESASSSEATAKKEVKSCICTKEYQPVCGEDKMTYSNTCSANCAEVKVAHNGSCIETMGKK